LFTVIASCIIVHGAKVNHYGTHVQATATTTSLRAFLRGLWVFQITYTLSVSFSKLSILALYWRVFVTRSMRISLWVIIGITIGWTIAVTIAAIFSCIPIHSFWYFELRSSAKCINSQAYFVSTASINIFIDIIMLALPLFMIRRLQMAFAHKLAVASIFLLGMFATVASGLRLHALSVAYGQGIHEDPTWVLTGGGIWSSIETGVSIVCACMPSMRPLLKLMLHGRLSSSNKHINMNTLHSRRTATGHGQSVPFGLRGRSTLASIDIEEVESGAKHLGMTRSGEDNTGLVNSAEEFAGAGALGGSQRSYGFDDPHATHGTGGVWVKQDFHVETTRRPSNCDVDAGKTTAHITAWRDNASESSASSLKDASVGGEETLRQQGTTSRSK
jgi:hypothetical protein